MIDLLKLYQQLERAGLPVVSVAAVGDTDPVTGRAPDATIELAPAATAAQRALAAEIKAAHDPDAPLDPDAAIFEALRTSVQADAEARQAMAALMTGLDGLPPADKGYVLFVRLMGLADGYTPEQAQAVATKAQALAYVTGKPEWKAVPPATQPMLADIMETVSLLTSALILALS